MPRPKIIYNQSRSYNGSFVLNAQFFPDSKCPNDIKITFNITPHKCVLLGKMRN